MEMLERSRHEARIPVTGGALQGELDMPTGAIGLVAFAHGSGSSRFSPRNRHVARILHEHGLATLLVDLLTPAEEIADRRDAHLRFDIGLLARRVGAVVEWCTRQPELASLPIGLFGASTGAAAALAAAAHDPESVVAIVSRGGRPDLAGELLELVQCPTLLIVGSRDDAVLEMNRAAAARMHCSNELLVIPGATHLFEEPGTLDRAARAAAEWFVTHLGRGADHASPSPTPRTVRSTHTGPYRDRLHAGQVLAHALATIRDQLVHPVVIALPRGGVETAVPVASSLGLPIEVVIVRKVGAPNQPELALGAVDEEGGRYVDDQLVHELRVSGPQLHELVTTAIDEARRRADRLRDGPAPSVAGRDVVLVDDGYATGSTAIAAARMLRRHHARSITLAVPVGPPSLLTNPPAEFDRVVCPYAPRGFRAVGFHYHRFDQVGDDAVRLMLQAARPEQRGIVT